MVLLDRHQEGSIETLQHTCRKTPGCSPGLRCPVEKQQQQKKQLRAVKRVLQCTKISTQL